MTTYRDNDLLGCATAGPHRVSYQLFYWSFISKTKNLTVPITSYLPPQFSTGSPHFATLKSIFNCQNSLNAKQLSYLFPLFVWSNFGITEGFGDKPKET